VGKSSLTECPFLLDQIILHLFYCFPNSSFGLVTWNSSVLLIAKVIPIVNFPKLPDGALLHYLDYINELLIIIRHAPSEIIQKEDNPRLFHIGTTVSS